MIKREAKFTTVFRHWLKANPMYSAAFELKQTKTNTLPFPTVKEHQIDALLAAEGEHGVIYKAPDDSRGVKPFDLFYLRLAGAYVVIKYPGCFVVIDASAFNREKITAKPRASLHLDRAKEIAEYVVNLKKE